jgi:hypothetical protein
MPKRCLIIGCSQTKLETPNPVPALARYDGPPFRVLRRYLNDPSSANGARPAVFVLSAEYGLIEGARPIPVYDRRMTRQRADHIRAEVLQTFEEQIAARNYEDVFISTGKTYLLALAGFEALLPATTSVQVSRSPSGQKLAELKAWLNGQEESSPGQLSLPLNVPNDNGYFTHPITGIARLKGVELKATPEEVYNVARQALRHASRQDTALATDNGHPNNFKNWYVLVDEQRVSPKWLVSQLTNLPVRNFDAAAARRVLNKLGVPVYKNE